MSSKNDRSSKKKKGESQKKPHQREDRKEGGWVGENDITRECKHLPMPVQRGEGRLARKDPRKRKCWGRRPGSQETPTYMPKTRLSKKKKQGFGG